MATAVQPLTGTYELDRTHSTFQFAVTHIDVSTFLAPFADIDARLTAKEDTIELEGRALAESVSITEPQEFRDHVVRGTDFFDADAHPLITFRSTSVVLGDDGAASVTGELTIRGVSRSVVAHGTYRLPTEDPFGTYRAGLELRATVDRRNWDMSWQARLPDGGDALGWEVEITVHLELIRKDGCVCSRSAAASGAPPTTALLEAAAAECPADVEFVVLRASQTSRRTTRIST